MKKKTAVIILLILLCTVLFGCGGKNTPDLDPADTLEKGVNALLENDIISIDATVTVDGKTTDRIVGAIDRNMKQGKISVNGLDHYYFGQLIFVAEGSGIKVGGKAGFDEFLRMTGANLVNSFQFKKDNFHSVVENEGVILADFVGNGSAYSFPNTGKAFSGGTLSAFFNDGVVTKTVFSSYFEENLIIKSYTAVVKYAPVEKAWETTPAIIPSSDPIYAEYLLKKLSALYPNKTLKLASSGYDTLAKMEDVPDKPNLMSTVFAAKGGSLYTVTITYKNAERIYGINGSVRTIDICFDAEYTVAYLFINSGNKYVLS